MIGSVEFCLIHDQGSTKRSVNAANGYVGNRVFEHPMPSQDSLRIAAVIAIDRNAKHNISVGKIGCRRCRDHFWTLEWRNRVSFETALSQFVQTDGCVVGFNKVLRKPGVRSAIEVMFKLAVLRMWFVLLCPNPLKPF